MASILRFAAAVCCALSMSACSYTYTSKSNVGPAARVDDMIVSVQDVRNIAAAEDFAPHTEADLQKPPPADPTAPEPCRAVGYNDLTFGGGWSDFRSAGYKGSPTTYKPAETRWSTKSPRQWPDTRARTRPRPHSVSSNRRYKRASRCTIRTTSSGWTSRIPRRCGSPTFSGVHLYRVKSAVLVSVGVLGLEASDQIANTVLQTITDRIK